MDKEVTHKIDRLIDRYKTTVVELEALRPSSAPTARQRRFIVDSTASVVRKLAIARRPSSMALVQLAYVRSLRAVDPKGSLSPEQVVTVNTFTWDLERLLGITEMDQVNHMRHYLSQLSVTKHLEGYGSLPQTRRGLQPYPLVARAHANVSYIVDMASVAGALAGTQAGSYDEVPNAD